MNKKVLIVHGWMHSHEVYTRLYRDLRDYGYKSDIFVMHGLDDRDLVYSCDRLIDYYSAGIRHKVDSGEYDAVIAHDMGAALVLNAIADGMKDCNILLVAPVVNASFGKRLLKPLTHFIPMLLDRIEDADDSRLIKIFSYPTIGKYWYFAQIDKAVEKCNNKMAKIALKELMANNVPYTTTYNSIHLLDCTKDKIMTPTQKIKLVQRLGDSLVEYRQIETGHSPMLTDYEVFFDEVKHFLKIE